MNLRFALRDEKVNIYALTKGNPYGAKTHQIILCKKEPSVHYGSGPFLLDAKRSDPAYKLSSEGRKLLNSIASHEFELNYLAYIDCQLSVAIKPGLFEMLTREGYFSIWDPSAPYKYFEGAAEGFLLLFRVFRINQSIDESLLERGRSGRNWYYYLDHALDIDVSEPVISHDSYKFLKNGLVNLLDQCGYLRAKVNLMYMKRPMHIEFYTKNNVIDDSPATAYTPSPQQKKPLILEQDGDGVYPRDQKIALNALKLARYKCEFDASHWTFIRKRDGKPYTEPHHLIPLSSHADFTHDLDVEANIVSLCSHCHNLLHYGKEYYEILKNLYEKRKEQLAKAGLSIEFKELVEYYE